MTCVHYCHDITIFDGTVVIVMAFVPASVLQDHSQHWLKQKRLSVDNGLSNFDVECVDDLHNITVFAGTMM